MGNKTIKLTEEEFYRIVKDSVNEIITEIDGRTYARVHNATIKAQQDQIGGKPSANPKKTNIDTIIHGISLDPRAANSLIEPYKTSYTFHCVNLRGTASLTIFTLEQLYLLKQDKAILKGKIVFNGEQLHGSIIVDMNTKKVYYNYKGKKPIYSLTIDPSKKDLWNDLLKQLDLSLESRTI